MGQVDLRRTLRRTLRLGPVLAGLALAGCYGMCGYTPESAAWVEPGLYDWLGSNPVEGAEQFAGGGGLPFDGEVEGARPHSVRSLSWQREGHFDTPALALDPDGVAWATGSTLPEAEIRVLFRGFAEDVSAANATALDEAEDAFVASREVAAGSTHDENGTEHDVDLNHYRVQMPGPYRLEALAVETGATFGPYVPDPYREPGTAYAQGGGYAWTFTLSYWTVAVDDGSISVDMLDRVRVDGLFAENDDDGDVERKVRRAFAEAGLPEPGMEGLQHGGSIC